MGGSILANAISQARQLQLTAGEHILSGTPTASATKSLLRLGNAISGASANGVFVGINAPPAYAGDLLWLQIAGSASPALNLRSEGTGTTAILGLGRVPANGFTLDISGTADDGAAGSIRIRNTSTGTSAFSQFQCNSSSAAGIFGVAHSAFTGAGLLQNRVFVRTAGGTETGISLDANRASQDIRCNVGLLNEQMRLTSAGELLVGTTSSLGRVAIVGRQDQIQLVVRGNATQTANQIAVQQSAAVGGGGQELWYVTAGGNLGFARESSSTSGRDVASISATFATSTDASRTGRLTLSVTDFNATREGLRVETDGSVARVAIGGIVPNHKLQVRHNSTTGFLVENSETPGASAGAGLQGRSVTEPSAADQRLGFFFLGAGANGTIGWSAFSTQAWTGSARGSYMIFETVTNATTSRTERIRLTDLGDIELRRTSSTTDGRKVGSWVGTFAVNTDASRQGRIQLFATDSNGDREILRGEGDGTNPKIGFLGTNAFRATGWAAATGTATRATFDTTSVTLAVLAEHVKALVDDLFTSGYGLLRA